MNRSPARRAGALPRLSKHEGATETSPSAPVAPNELPRRQYASGVDAKRRTLRHTSRGKIIGRSLVLASVIDVIDRVAPTSCTVLVTGETGTGKEAVVAALHDASARRFGPLVTVNCAALPDNLVESELFGHERGAFTGAEVARRGCVAEADGGTLFLDEIGELPLKVQVKILRLLQQREYRPVGAAAVLRSDVRFVAATNANLRELVAQGSFREDLFFRLSVVEIHLPPLRERNGDVVLLADYFLRCACEATGRSDLRGFAPDAARVLGAHAWPGNVRELENLVHRAMLFVQGPLVTAAELLPLLSPSTAAPRPPLNLPPGGMDLRAATSDYERSLILQALERTGWNRKQAAKLLGIQRTTLLEMIRRLALCR